MNIRDMMELGDFVHGAQARYPTTLELTTRGLLIVAHSTHPSTGEPIHCAHRLTLQQTHDWRLPEVREVVTDMWRQVDMKAGETRALDVRGKSTVPVPRSPRPPHPSTIQVRAAKPVCRDCQGTGTYGLHHACVTCDGRGWVVEARK